MSYRRSGRGGEGLIRVGSFVGLSDELRLKSMSKTVCTDRQGGGCYGVRCRTTRIMRCAIDGGAAVFDRESTAYLCCGDSKRYDKRSVTVDIRGGTDGQRSELALVGRCVFRRVSA